jgi:Tol biopolymer transport system component
MAERQQRTRRGIRLETGAFAVIVLVAALALAAASAAAAASHATAGTPQWLLFTARPAGLGVEQIYRIQASGKGLKRLTKGAYPAEGPAFSPDGKTIAFARVGAGIYRMNVDGSGLHALTGNGRDSFPAWSPDGKQIAFIRPGANGWLVYVVSSSGARAKVLSQSPPAGRPTWTDKGLLVPTNGDLAKIDPRSGQTQRLFGALIDASIGMDTTAISPDGSTVTFVGARPPDPGDTGCGEGVPCQRFGLFIQQLKAKKSPKTLVLNAGPAAFAPDGRHVAYVLTNKLTVEALAGGETRSVKTGKLLLTTSTPPAWQPR